MTPRLLRTLVAVPRRRKGLRVQGGLQTAELPSYWRALGRASTANHCTDRSPVTLTADELWQDLDLNFAFTGAP
jgi:hypothetical protein